MKQLIIIVPSTLDKKFSMARAKKAIVEFIGTRLIDTDTNEMPGVILKQCLSKEDKKKLNSTIFPNSSNGCLIFIEFDEMDAESNCDYINAELCEEADE